jgi:hypothetical protein
MPVQPKLAIGQPGDKNKQGAEVAKLLPQRINAPEFMQQNPQTLQRQVMAVGQEEIQMKPILQLQPDEGGMEANQEENVPSLMLEMNLAKVDDHIDQWSPISQGAGSAKINGYAKQGARYQLPTYLAEKLRTDPSSDPNNILISDKEIIQLREYWYRGVEAGMYPQQQKG